MKKYLMTGVAAIAICAAFTSCSKNEELYDPDQIQQNEIAKVYENYNRAFIATFGQPAANHNWGFIDYSKAGTRAHTYMNGNMEKYYDAPTKGATEENDVEAYVHALTSLPAKAAPSWQNYFVTQIHDGEKDYNTQKSVDGNTTYVAGKQMDELAFAMQESAVILDNGLLQGDWIHINNFNNANNTDWNGNTLVEEGGTFDFAYKSSADSKYHNRWIGIDGADIDAYYNNNGTYSGSKYAEYYYICFDFESTGNAKTVIKWKENGTPYQAYLFGSWTNINDVPAGTTIYNTQWNSETNSEDFIPQGTVYLQEGTTNWELDNVVNGNMVVNGNNDYTDWIIRLYKAKEKNEEPAEWDLRIICEDLNATATEEDPDDSDWDFNDLVLDVKFLEGDNVRMRVYAVGATLPIRINGESGLEAHGLYGQPTNMMINTGAAAAGYPAQAYESNNYPIIERRIEGVRAAYGANIKIEVEKGTDNWIALQAKAGEPASKMGVLPDFEPCSERQDITGRYSRFVAWINTLNPVYWWRPSSQQ